nr:immunoglobulin heavy chain junction region [Macaca mulatta]MOX91768.1 immunoglobulin heavy chain junction region [Macaca mulatta]
CVRDVTGSGLDFW